MSIEDERPGEQDDHHSRGHNDRRYHGQERRKDEWHLSKNVPITLVAALIIQTVVLTTWAATFKAEFVSYRQTSEKEFVEMKAYIDARTQDRYTWKQAQAELKTRDVVLNTLKDKDSEILQNVRSCQNNISDRLRRIEDKLDEHVLNSHRANGNSR